MTRVYITRCYTSHMYRFPSITRWQMIAFILAMAPVFLFYLSFYDRAAQFTYPESALVPFWISIAFWAALQTAFLLIIARGLYVIKNWNFGYRLLSLLISLPLTLVYWVSIPLAITESSWLTKLYEAIGYIWITRGGFLDLGFLDFLFLVFGITFINVITTIYLTCRRAQMSI